MRRLVPCKDCLPAQAAYLPLFGAVGVRHCEPQVKQSDPQTPVGASLQLMLLLNVRTGERARSFIL